MDGLVEKDLVHTDSVRTFAHNRLVVIAAKDRPLAVNGLQDLLKPEVRQISIGDPGSVPVGQYSVEVLTNQQLLDQVQGKLIYANNVRQVLQYVEQGEVDLGFVYATDVGISKQVKVHFTVPEEYHKPITYPIGVVKESQRREIATDFIEWVLSKQGRKVLQEYGFTPVQ
jgi:molybdate transport system substrate-binding protein